jgi:Raf kinase inhibitor-like YbhB/YbcL family protein
MPRNAEFSNGAVHGKTDFGKLGYGGPCPPSGTHRYFFKLYALDRQLDLASGATKKQVEAAMKGHVLASAELMGRYTRQSKK